MSFDRTAAATALAAAISDYVADVGETVTVLPKLPATINPPAIIVGRQTEVQYSQFALSIDEATLPVLCVGAIDGDDRVAELVALVRYAITDPKLGGAVQDAHPTGDRNWRAMNVAGADVLVAEVTFQITM